MPEFSLELYRSRSAEIEAQRAEAQAAYEAAALASALDPSAGGQLEARALVADLDAQQEALDAAYAEFKRQEAVAAHEAERSAWEADAEKIHSLTSQALAQAREKIEAMIPILRELVTMGQDVKSQVRELLRGYRYPAGQRQSATAYYNPLWDFNKHPAPSQSAITALEDLLEAFDELESHSSKAIEFVEPKLQLKDAA